MSQPSLILPPGSTLGGYEIEDVLGVGGMAVVYRAIQTSLGRRVALKVLNPRLAADSTFRERFRREGALVATLDHPGVIPVYDSGEADGRLYLAMRLVDGETLGEHMANGLSASESLTLLAAVAAALDAAHDAGLLHRDVKPQNILISGAGHVYLADFGVAKGAGVSNLTATQGFLGSVNYVAPEQIRGAEVGPAADTYALAVVAYECLTGRTPFARDTEAAVIHAHLSDDPPVLSTAGERWTDAAGAALAAGLVKDPAQRSASASDFVRGLARALSGAPADLLTRVPAFPPAGFDVPPVSQSAAGAAAGLDPVIGAGGGSRVAPGGAAGLAAGQPVAEATPAAPAGTGASSGHTAAPAGRPQREEAAPGGRSRRRERAQAREAREAERAASRAASRAALPATAAATAPDDEAVVDSASGHTIHDRRRSELVPEAERRTGADTFFSRAPWAILVVAVAVPVAVAAFTGDKPVSRVTVGPVTTLPVAKWSSSVVKRPALVATGGLLLDEAVRFTAPGRNAIVLVGAVDEASGLAPKSLGKGEKATRLRVSGGTVRQWQAPEKGGVERVAVAATGASAIAVVCHGPAAVSGPACDRVLGALRAKDGTLLGDPDGAIATTLAAALKDAAAARRKTLPIKDRTARARTAKQIATAYAGAARHVAALQPARPWDRDLTRLVDGLGSTSRAFTSLQKAAEGKDTSRDKRARGLLASADRSVDTALGRLDRRGYDVKD